MRHWRKTYGYLCQKPVRQILARLVLALAILAGAMQAPAAVAAPQAPTDGGKVYLPMVSHRVALSYRMGYGTSISPLQQYADLASLKAGWYLNWAVEEKPARPNGIEFVQMVRVHQKLTCPLYSANAHDRNLCPYVVPHQYIVMPELPALAAAVRANPGSLWLIGNEMDRRDWQGGGQDEMVPELYAIAYRDLYHFIKDIDPTARIAIGGVIQATPLRLQYLTRIWDAYQQYFGTTMPVDVWNVHNFILREVSGLHGADIPAGIDVQRGVDYPSDDTHVDMGLFDQQIRAFRQWMKDRGQQQKPLIVTEYGVLYGHTSYLQDPNVVVGFMENTFNYFLNTKDCNLGLASDDCRLVQRWNWYSLEDKYGWFNTHSALFDPNTGRITYAGERFRAFSLNNLGQLSQQP